jgi:uncharacterized membrane protein
MPPTVRQTSDEPAHSDAFIRGLSESIGGPLGEHAVRSPARMPGGSKFWTPMRIVLALVCATLALSWVQKSPCSDGQWTDLKQYKYFCYTDVLALYYAEHLSDGAIPYKDHAVEYPVVTGIFMGLIGLPIHALGPSVPGGNEGQAFYDVNALALAAFGVAACGAILAVRRRRPWDAALFAVAPALFFSATVNWDLLCVGLTALGMAAWAKRHPALAGLLLGLAIGAKFYPLLIIGPMILLAVRTKRFIDLGVTVAGAVSAWAVVNGPIAILWPASWSTFFRFNSDRGIDWGTLWYIGAHFPRGGGQYGFDFFRNLDADPKHSTLNTLYLLLFVFACIAIAALIFLAPRRPRLGQVAFLVVAMFLIVGKVWSQQYVLWLIPLAVLARPRWGAFLAWQAAEVLYFLSFYGELMGASGKPVFPEGVFVLASMLRLATLAILVGYVVRDILVPERDVVRHTYADDPDGGVFDGAPDSGIVEAIRRFFGSEPSGAEPVLVGAGAGVGAGMGAAGGPRVAPPILPGSIVGPSSSSLSPTPPDPSPRPVPVVRSPSSAGPEAGSVSPSESPVREASPAETPVSPGSPVSPSSAGSRAEADSPIADASSAVVDPPAPEAPGVAQAGDSTDPETIEPDSYEQPPQ